ncbi:hypothetical protein [Clostridium gasigenes]|uniref:hypothetical protein n=1 Tax=Clostridium gasigenes TaxID=94869 RepID=UPI001C0BF466|nr:hypothetical protein [Clostridium gasigenes]MBU3107554.1 hypothetical protein [Clostridium gasigenes]
MLEDFKINNNSPLDVEGCCNNEPMAESENILSPGGYLNMFWTTLLVIHKGKVKDFKIYEILGNGKKQYVEDDQDCKNRD